VGQVPKPATRIENACGSGGVTLRHGVIAIASGLFDMVLVGGCEKMTNLSTEKVTDALAAAGDIIYETNCGLTFPSLYANMATAHMHKYGTKPEHLMKVGIKNHRNGALNPKAQFNQTIADIMKSKQDKAREKGTPVPQWADEMAFMKDEGGNPVVAWPLRLLIARPLPTGQGVLCWSPVRLPADLPTPPLYHRNRPGSDHALPERETLSSLAATKEAALQAYSQAGVASKDIDIAEVHDCFTIAEIMAIEDLGFFLSRPGS